MDFTSWIWANGYGPTVLCLKIFFSRLESSACAFKMSVVDDIQMAGLTEAELEELSEFMDPDVSSVVPVLMLLISRHR